ncbi:MAG: ice-binding family protein [Thaumarchaeota archaeon]|nr:ice-binding family protein [Nitrososphaerota archaeon]
MYLALLLVSLSALVVPTVATSVSALPPSLQPVDLGLAGNFAILAETAITTTGVTHITGNLGISPAASTAMTGFGPVLDSSGTFSISPLVTGQIYASNYAAPTPSMLSTAVGNMESAYTTANGLTTPAPVNELGSGNIGGLTLTALSTGNIYKWSTAVTIPSALTIDCTPNPSAVFVLQIAQGLTVSANVSLIQCLPQHIFWIVAGITTLESGVSMQGIVLDQTQVIFDSGATLVGDALAQSQVTLIGNSITEAPTTSAPYNVTFDQTGIPTTGVTWGVTVGGTHHTGTGSNITLTGLTGIQPYSYDSPVAGATGTQYASTCSGLVSAAGTQSCGYTTQYQVSFAVSPFASGTTSPSATTYYNAGTGLSISATANSGYAFSSWSNGEASITFTSSVSSTTTATINGPGTITVEFSSSGNPNPNPNPSPNPSLACVNYSVYDYFVGTTLVGTGTEATYPGPNIQLVAGGPIYGGSNVTVMLDPSLSCLT